MYKKGLITQLLVTFATMIAHVGIFDNKWATDGGFKLASPIEESSDFPSVLMSWVLLGWFAMVSVQINVHTNPRIENSVNGPVMPNLFIRTGVAIKLIALPKWNPAMERPTPLARPQEGNHCDKITFMDGKATPSARPKRMRTVISVILEWLAAHGVIIVASDQKTTPTAITSFPPYLSTKAPPTVEDTRYPHKKDDCNS